MTRNPTKRRQNCRAPDPFSSFACAAPHAQQETSQGEKKISSLYLIARKWLNHYSQFASTEKAHFST